MRLPVALSLPSVRLPVALSLPSVRLGVALSRAPTSPETNLPQGRRPRKRVCRKPLAAQTEFTASRWLARRVYRQAASAKTSLPPPPPMHALKDPPLTRHYPHNFAGPSIETHLCLTMPPHCSRMFVPHASGCGTALWLQSVPEKIAHGVSTWVACGYIAEGPPPGNAHCL